MMSCHMFTGLVQTIGSSTLVSNSNCNIAYTCFKGIKSSRNTIFILCHLGKPHANLHSKSVYALKYEAFSLKESAEIRRWRHIRSSRPYNSAREGVVPRTKVMELSVEKYSSV